MPDQSSNNTIAAWSNVPRAELEAFGDAGDLTRQYLLNPTILGLLGSVAGRRILDAGCGQGYLARMLARAGALIVGVEPAAPLISYAREREAAEPLGIVYEQADLTTWMWRHEPFDCAVANMVLMDIAGHKPHGLKPGGLSLALLLHQS